VRILQKWKSPCLHLLGVVFCALAGPALAQLQDENLLAPMPEGFKSATQQVQGGVVFQEWIPSGESLANWSEMVTIQILLGKKDIDGGRYLGGIRSEWLKACPETRPNAVTAGRTNGYPNWSMDLQCPRLANTGKPETTLFRSFQGRDSFYSVQRSARAVPDGAQRAKMAAYIESVTVCDTRSSAHPCPDLKRPGSK